MPSIKHFFGYLDTPTGGIIEKATGNKIKRSKKRMLDGKEYGVSFDSPSLDILLENPYRNALKDLILENSIVEIKVREFPRKIIQQNKLGYWIERDFRNARKQAGNVTCPHSDTKEFVAFWSDHQSSSSYPTIFSDKEIWVRAYEQITKRQYNWDLFKKTGSIENAFEVLSEKHLQSIHQIVLEQRKHTLALEWKMGKNQCVFFHGENFDIQHAASDIATKCINERGNLYVSFLNSF